MQTQTHISSPLYSLNISYTVTIQEAIQDLSGTDLERNEILEIQTTFNNLIIQERSTGGLSAQEPSVQILYNHLQALVKDFYHFIHNKEALSDPSFVLSFARQINEATTRFVDAALSHNAGFISAQPHQQRPPQSWTSRVYLPSAMELGHPTPQEQSDSAQNLFTPNPQQTKEEQEGQFQAKVNDEQWLNIFGIRLSLLLISREIRPSDAEFLMSRACSPNRGCNFAPDWQRWAQSPYNEYVKKETEILSHQPPDKRALAGILFRVFFDARIDLNLSGGDAIRHSAQRRLYSILNDPESLRGFFRAIPLVRDNLDYNQSSQPQQQAGIGSPGGMPSMNHVGMSSVDNPFRDQYFQSSFMYPGPNTETQEEPDSGSIVLQVDSNWEQTLGVQLSTLLAPCSKKEGDIQQIITDVFMEKNRSSEFDPIHPDPFTLYTWGMWLQTKQASYVYRELSVFYGNPQQFKMFAFLLGIYLSAMKVTSSTAACQKQNRTLLNLASVIQDPSQLSSMLREIPFVRENMSE